MYTIGSDGCTEQGRIAQIKVLSFRGRYILKKVIKRACVLEVYPLHQYSKTAEGQKHLVTVGELVIAQWLGKHN